MELFILKKRFFLYGMNKMKEKACFLDRDGTLNVEIKNLHEPEKVKLEKNVPEALKLLKNNGFKLIVITNQAGIASGVFDEKDLAAVHNKIQELLKEHGVQIDKFYHCPHHPKFSGECKCRKPGTALFAQAVEEFDIDIRQSFMIGDRITDIQAGEDAFCKKTYLVKTGYGIETIFENSDYSFNVAEDILDAAQKIVNQQ